MTTAAERKALFEQYFGGSRRWRVLTELTGTTQHADGCAVTFTRGAAEVEAPGAFKMPWGGGARKGFVIREVGADGVDIPGSMMTVTRQALVMARDRYGAIAEVPDE